MFRPQPTSRKHPHTVRHSTTGAQRQRFSSAAVRPGDGSTHNHVLKYLNRIDPRPPVIDHGIDPCRDGEILLSSYLGLGLMLGNTHAPAEKGESADDQKRFKVLHCISAPLYASLRQLRRFEHTGFEPDGKHSLTGERCQVPRSSDAFTVTKEEIESRSGRNFEDSHVTASLAPAPRGVETSGLRPVRHFGYGSGVHSSTRWPSISRR